MSAATDTAIAHSGKPAVARNIVRQTILVAISAQRNTRSAIGYVLLDRAKFPYLDLYSHPTALWDIPPFFLPD
jgi:hypothetical protein